jgi:hypothetical protein
MTMTMPMIQTPHLKALLKKLIDENPGATEEKVMKLFSAAVKVGSPEAKEAMKF